MARPCRTLSSPSTGGSPSAKPEAGQGGELYVLLLVLNVLLIVLFYIGIWRFFCKKNQRVGDNTNSATTSSSTPNSSNLDSRNGRLDSRVLSSLPVRVCDLARFPRRGPRRRSPRQRSPRWRRPRRWEPRRCPEPRARLLANLSPADNSTRRLPRPDDSLDPTTSGTDVFRAPLPEVPRHDFDDWPGLDRPGPPLAFDFGREVGSPPTSRLEASPLPRSLPPRRRLATSRRIWANRNGQSELAPGAQPPGRAALTPHDLAEWL